MGYIVCAMTVDLSLMAQEISLTEAETGRRLFVRHSAIKRILPCYAGTNQYGLYRHAYARGLERESPVWNSLASTKLPMCQIEWKDRRPPTFVLHHIAEIASGYSRLHMNPLLLKTYAQEIDRIAKWISDKRLPDIVHVPCNFGLEAAVLFDDPAFTTFPATIGEIRRALQTGIPLGALEQKALAEPAPLSLLIDISQFKRPSASRQLYKPA